MSTMVDDYQVMTRDKQNQLNLCNAVQSKDVRGIISAIAHGADVNERDVYSRQPLAIAVGMASVPTLRLLLAAGALPSCMRRDDKFNTEVLSESDWCQTRRVLRERHAAWQAYAGSFLVTPGEPRGRKPRNAPPSPRTFEDALLVKGILCDARAMHRHGLAFCLACLCDHLAKVKNMRAFAVLETFGVNPCRVKHSKPCRATPGMGGTKS